MSILKKNNVYRRKKVNQYTLDMKYITTYESVLIAALSLNKKQGSAITEACNGIREYAYGYKWKYN